MANNSARNRRISIICPQYSPEKGAAPSRMTKLAGGLHARGFQVEVFTALPNYPTGRIFAEYRGKVWHTEHIDGILVKRYWLYPSNSAMVLKRLLNMISLSTTLFFALPHLLRTRPAILIVNTPPLPVGMTGITLAKIVRARVITNVSDIWPGSALELGAIRRGRLYSLLERLERFVYRHSNAVMTQSNQTRDHVLDRFPEKQAFLYRNLDHPSNYIDQYPMPDGHKLKIVYAGLLGVAQGVYDICRSVDFKRLGTEFHLYGDGNEREKINQYITEHPDSNIFLHDSVPKCEIPKLLTEFHATIIPLKSNIRGAFPSKIYMAISASLPVLFCGAGEGAQFIDESGIGWVSGPGDYQALSENIRELSMMTNDKYRSLRELIKSLATTTYDFEDQLNQLVSFFDSVD